MTAHDAKRFGVALFTLAEVFGETISEARIGLYFKTLADLRIEQVEMAIEATARSSKFFPRPVELREAVLGSPEDQAIRAWARMLSAVRLHGAYSSVDFRDPVLHVVIEQMGGWDRVASEMPADEKEKRFIEATFLRHYRTVALKMPARVPPHLPGVSEIANRANFGAWTRGLGHRDEVLVLDRDGVGVLAKRPALPVGSRPPEVEMGKVLALPDRKANP